MKKIILIIVSALLVASCTVTAIAISINSEQADTPVTPGDPIDSVVEAEINSLRATVNAIISEPISFDSSEIFKYNWNTLGGAGNLRYENGRYVYDYVSNIPQLSDEFLESTSTEKLIEFAIGDALTMSRMLSSDSVHDSVYDYLIKNVSLFAELENRPDTAYYLLKKYLSAPVDVEDVKEGFRMKNIEFLLTRKPYAQSLTDEQFKIFVLRLHENFAARDNSKIVSNADSSIMTYDEYVVERYNDVCGHFAITPMQLDPKAQTSTDVIDKEYEAVFMERLNRLR